MAESLLILQVTTHQVTRPGHDPGELAGVRAGRAGGRLRAGRPPAALPPGQVPGDTAVTSVCTDTSWHRWPPRAPGSPAWPATGAGSSWPPASRT